MVQLLQKTLDSYLESWTKSYHMTQQDITQSTETYIHIDP